MTVNRSPRRETGFNRDIEDIYPLSDIEKGMVFHSLKNAGVYHSQMVFQLKIPRFDPVVFEKAFSLMMEKHGKLRTCYNMYEFEEPVQVVYKQVPGDIGHYDLSGQERYRQEAFVKKMIEEDREDPFNVENPQPLWRARTFNLGGDNILLLWIAHHAMIDGWSFASLMTELNNTYFKLKSHPHFVPGKLKSTYKEFVIQQILEKRKSENIEYWKRELADYKRLKFPGEFRGLLSHPHEVSDRKRRRKDLARFRGELMTAAQTYNTSVKNLCFGAYVFMLNMLSYDNDIVVGLVANNRPVCEDGDKIIGCFLNTLPVRMRIPVNTGWKDYIRFVDRKLLELKKYERVSLFEINRLIGEKTQDRNPLFDTIFNFVDFHVYELLDRSNFSENPWGGDEGVLPIQGGGTTNTLFDFSINAGWEGLEISLSYEGAVVANELVDRLFHYFASILEKFCSEPDGLAAKHRLMPEDEKQKLLYLFNDSDAGYPRENTVHELFAEQVERIPDNIAVNGQGYGVQLTYCELNDISNQLAHLLRGKGVKPDTIVGILVERSIEMIVGILAILKAGGSYLPVSPGYPAARKRDMLEDSQAVLLLTDGDREWVPGFIANDIEVVDIRDRAIYPHPGEVRNLKNVTGPSNLVYVMYTSGSTGKPKGVMLEHGNAVNVLTWFRRNYNIGEGTHVLQMSDFTFDPSVNQILGSLISGAALYLIQKELLTDVELLRQFIEIHQVQVLYFVPALLNELLDDEKKLESIEAVISGGERLADSVKDNILAKGYVLYNQYGPTEAAIDALAEKSSKKKVALGQPVSNVRCYIFDKEKNLTTIQVTGELYIGGAGVARGYLNQPELTAEKFLSFSYKSYWSYRTYFSKKIYKTGDLARWLPDGNIEFIGRMDHQVKIRGYRVEPGEIENRLMNREEIKEAVVIAYPGKAADKYLCAYLAADKEIDIPGLKEFLSGSLPDYMIPSYFVRLDRMPLTPNGKIDRDALPVMGEGTRIRGRYTPPGDGTEKELVEIWSVVLGREKDTISIDDNFFDLGGHSLKAMVLISTIHKELNVKVPLAELFKMPSIRELAGYIRNTGTDFYEGIKPVEEREYYPQSSAQKRLYFLDKFENIGTSYNMSSLYKIAGRLDKERFENSFKALIAGHESLRTSFHLIDDEPVQMVHDEVEFEIEHYLATFIRPFDLSQVPLLRVGLMESGRDRYRLLVDIHHIISDGTSIGILVDDFIRLYDGELLPSLRVQYKDFACWQNSLFETGRIREQESYWLNLYPGTEEIPVLNMPTDFPRPAVFSFAGSHHEFKLEPRVVSGLKDLSAGSGANPTLYMTLLAALNILLHKYTGQEDIIVGSGIMGRSHADLQQIIGMFVNSLAMRNRPEGRKTCLGFVKETAENSVRAFENQDVQFEDLVDKLNLPRNPSRNPLFDVSFVVQNFEQAGKEMKSVSVVPDALEKRSSKFDLTLFAGEVGDEIDFTMEYCTALFKPGTIQRLAGHFLSVLRHMVENPGIKISEVDMLAEEEKQQLLHEFNGNVLPYPQDKTVHRLFAEQAGRSCDGTAVVCPGKDGMILTYGELNKESNRLAHYLYEMASGQGQPDRLVGILMDQSIDRIIAILGVLKAGAAYVPIDPSLPEERIKLILKEAGIEVLLSRKKYIKTLNRLQWECPDFRVFLCMDSWDVLAEEEEEKSELMDEALWKYVGETATDDITGGGWLNSYTGEPFTREEMDEYGDNILKKLEPLFHRKMKVLEIGCASGISMYRIAPEVGLYYGTDLSAAIIETNRKKVESEDRHNIFLACLAAHEIDKIEEKNFDLVIMNSVIQCFHGHNYLKKVIRKALDLMGPKGYLFIGDVMDRDLKEELIRDLTAFKQAHRDQNYKTKIDFSQELFVSRGFFEDLLADLPGIRDVEYSSKICTIENELTRFRYDVLMTVDKTGKPTCTPVEKHKYQHDVTALAKYEGPPLISQAGPDSLAYVIYTSGTTGVPKGVMIEHRSLVNLCYWQNRYFAVTEKDHAVLYAGFGFDASVWEIFPYLIKGAALHLIDDDIKLDIPALIKYFEKSNITIGFLPTQFCEQFMKEGGNNSSIRVLLTGGDKLNSFTCRSYELYNNYGPTENTVVTTSCLVETDSHNIPIGKPIANNRVYILNKDNMQLQPVGVAGELCISGEGLGRGYLNRPELTAEKFLSYFSERIYKTGDLARWLADGNIEFSGRIDQQAKIRGFRIELGEIESRLLKYDAVKEAVVIDRVDENGDKTLCAYIVITGQRMPSPIEELRDHLSHTLPDYMIPSYFIEIDRIPLTPGGKVDRKALPEPERKAGAGDSPPGNETEKRLVRIWSEVLDINTRPGIDDNFFELGGHSLKATILVSRIQKEFDVEFPLSRVFSGPTIREFGDFVKTAKRINYEEIKPAPKREYYPQSSAQKRLFFLDRFEEIGTSYNMPSAFIVNGTFDIEKFEHAIKMLIHRHESLRTSFHLIGDEPVQAVHDEVEFKIEGKGGPLCPPFEVGEIIKEFVRPFDLTKPPLVRVGLVEISREESLLLFDMHHIIGDGTSMGIVVDDFVRLYDGEKPPPLDIQYKDFALWQNNLFETGKIEEQEDYWLGIYPEPEEIPVLNLPTDFPRPSIFCFDGDRYEFKLEPEIVSGIRELNTGSGANVTLYMFLMAALNVLLYKYTGQEDIVVGIGIMGRRQANLHHIIGMFVNSLALCHHPGPNKTCLEFLEEVKETGIQAFENQDLQFEELVDKINPPRNLSRNPLFDVSLVVQNFEQSKKKMKSVTVSPYPRERKTSKFDLTLFADETGDEIYFSIEYCTALFRMATIERMAMHFLNIIRQMVTNPGIKIGEMDIIAPGEERQLIYDFNDTTAPFPKEKAAHRLFEEQAARSCDGVAVVCEEHRAESAEQLQITYKELNEKSNRLANYLVYEKHIQSEDRVGILMDRTVNLVAAVLGVLKAGAVYVPLDPGFPRQRLKHMIDDAGIEVVISRRKYIRTLNRLQWECSRFYTYLCVDSCDIRWEAEKEKSGLMDEKLWNYVGETAVDDITGGGWLSSYTGEPFTGEEMEEYGNNILVKLSPYLDREMRVLEIGCASGISMYRIAPQVAFYYGTDLSPVIIEKNRERVKVEGHRNIALSALAAHEIDRLEEKNFDLVIINSVIQAFPGHNYLRLVIRKCLALMGERGYFFIGDVMDQELKDSLVEEMIRFKAAARNREGNFKTKTDFSQELFISRAFFQDLSLEIPGIRGVEFSRKIYTVENELTKFRYDVLITVDKTLEKKERTGVRHKYQQDLNTLEKYSASAVKPVSPVKTGNLAYIIYTSGTSGQPKGVMSEHRGMSNLQVFFEKAFNVNDRDRVLQFARISFDASVWEIFMALFSGASLYLVSRETIGNYIEFEEFLVKNNITIATLPPPYLAHLDSREITSLRIMVTAGSETNIELVNKWKGKSNYINAYGPTETTICATSWRAPGKELNCGRIPIGKPILNFGIYILDSSHRLQPVNVPGELCISGEGLGRGYLNQPELTAGKFIFYFSEKIYKTGDLARWLADGNIEFLGRIDHQVKIRGYRIELGEIESRLLKHDAVKEAVVIDRVDENGDKTLCAYIVITGQGAPSLIEELRNHLSHTLPDYMLPFHFIELDKIPLTPAGKVDRKALPEPGRSAVAGSSLPGNEIEKKLAQIWSDVLGIQTHPGIDDNFFESGGHSLKATILVSRVQKEFNVEFPLSRVFSGPTIRELGDFVKTAKRINYQEIKPAPKREYYPQSSAQKRLFFLDRFEEIGTSYNMPSAFIVNGTFDIEKFEHAIKMLIHRHESLRTSFHLIGDEPVQAVHDEVEFKIEGRGGPLCPPFEVGEIIQEFVRPFDLSKPPLVRVGLLEISREESLLLFDMHHIIGDGTSMGIVVDDFVRLYEGETLPPLDIQYKDFALWQNNLFASGKIKEQENYWLGIYPEPEEIPVLTLPGDFPRPPVFCFDGARYEFKLEPGIVREIRELNTGSGGNVTLYMFLMAALNILLYKYTAQEDMVVGIGIMGRRHANLHHIIGMFVNSLALRHHPGPDKTCLEFLEEVKETAVQAFENQDLQFEELVDKINPRRNLSRNPLFDVSLVVQNFEQAKKKMKSVTVSPYPRESKTSKFDLTLFAAEGGDEIHFSIEYCTALFRTATIERMAVHFLNVIRQMVTNPGIKLGEMDILAAEETRQLIYDFNDTTAPFPREKAMHRLFEEQAARSCDGVAVVCEEHRAESAEQLQITYKELNEKSNQLANYLLYERYIQPEDRVGILMDRTVNLVAAVLGVLKAGAVYVPLDPGFPQQRLKHMIDDAGIEVVISRGKYIRALNRLQWECPRFHTYLCVDSRDIHGEPEKEKSGLMDEKLWNYVGETAVDEITGGGWLSSYTGEPFTGEEMEEYGNNILVKLSPYLDREMRVLEIGCASGISMYRIAPKVAFYYGTDLSPVIIEKNRERVKAEGHQNIALSALAAHEIDRLEEKNFDLVIINSVIQAFHGHNYLRLVIKKCLALMGERGYFFIGDVMDQELKDSLIGEMIRFKASARNREGSVKTKTDFSQELFISRAFFQDLSLEIPGIRGVEFSRKIYTIENELTKFRYDVLITVDKTLEKKERTGVRHKYQQDLNTLEKYSASAVKPVSPVKTGNLAYIIYTSGTSGQPKGVMSEHRGMSNLQVFFEKAFNVNDRDRVLQFARISFDASVWEIFMALFSGASLYLVSRETIGNYIEFEEFLVKNNITIATLPPPYLAHLDSREITSLRILVTAGSETNIELVNKWKGKSNYINAYGPTETTICATSWRAPGKELNRGRIPIGKPILNFGIYILDGSHRLQPVNVPGELCISGEGLGRGYLNQPELTAEKFIFYFSEKIYKTGDLARWLADGNIEFLGRIDHQVKIRGYRIELGEIETRLVKHDAVKEAVVIDRVDENGDKTLCAYIVIIGQGTLSLIEELRNHLSHTLPDYMLPSHFIEIDKIPLTPAGKVDRKALPSPGVQLKDLGSQPPRDELERKLAGLWSDVLGIEKEIIGIDANFFEIGGHSLKAAVLAARINKTVKLKIPLSLIFQRPTIRALASYIKRSPAETFTPIKAVEQKEYYDASYAQRRVWVLSQSEASSLSFNIHGAYLFKEESDIDVFRGVFHRLIERHESLRTVFLMIDGDVKQRILPAEEIGFSPGYVDLRAAEDREKKIKELVERDGNISFDLLNGPLLRVKLVQVEERKYWLLFTIHHIISDFLSMEVMRKEVVILFESLRRGEKNPLEPLNIQCRDYTAWQNEQFTGQQPQQLRKYWQDRFMPAETIPVLDLPYDKMRPSVLTYRGESAAFSITGEVTAGLKTLADENNATLFMVLLSSIYVLLFHYSGQTDIVIGTPVAGREHADLENQIGFYLNTLPLRATFREENTFIELLNMVRKVTLGAFEHQLYPFDRLVDELGIKRDMSRHPLFDVVVDMLNLMDPPGARERVETQNKITFHQSRSKFDLTVYLIEEAESIGVHFEYSTDLFEKKSKTIERMVNRFRTLLADIIYNTRVPISNLQLQEVEEIPVPAFSTFARD